MRMRVMVSCVAALALIALGCSSKKKNDDAASPGSGGANAAAPGSGVGSGGSSPNGSGDDHSGMSAPSGAGGMHADSGGSHATNGTGGTTTGSDDDGGAIGGGGDAGPSSSGAATGPFPAVSDLAGDGPFQATEIDETGPNNNYTVFLPTELAPNGAKNPIVGWMNGGSTGPALYVLLPHLATHGFVVVASNTLPAIGDEVALGQEIIAGIDWALDQNKQQGSMLFGKLDETKIAAMGYSMGSLATFTIADDPRLTTTVHISGGNMDPSRIDKLREPAAFFCGIPGDDSCTIVNTDCDIAGANCATDFMNATTPVFYGMFQYGHLGVLTDPYSTQIGAAVTGWLRWKLMSDRTLEQMFIGDQCTMCKDGNWTVKEKNF
jgi:dienelactone hydrolase